MNHLCGLLGKDGDCINVLAQKPKGGRAVWRGGVLLLCFSSLFLSSPPFSLPTHLFASSKLRSSCLLLLFTLQLSAIDVSARTTMKDAANCDKHCDLQNSVNQWSSERKLHFRDIPESMPASVSNRLLPATRTLGLPEVLLFWCLSVFGILRSVSHLLGPLTQLEHGKFVRLHSESLTSGVACLVCACLSQTGAPATLYVLLVRSLAHQNHS